MPRQGRWGRYTFHFLHFAMKDSFFVAPSRKRSRKPQATLPAKAEASDSDGPADMDELDLTHDHDVESDHSDNETAQEKRIRLAKQYISALKPSAAEEEDFDAAELDREIIGDRLRKDALEAAGRMLYTVSNRIPDAINVDRIRRVKGHAASVTCVAVTPNERFVYSGGKDGVIIKCKHRVIMIKTNGKGDVEKNQKAHTFRRHDKKKKDAKGHSDTVFSLAVSGDGQYLASGSKDKLICIWRVDTNEHVTTFKQHRDTVTVH
jgi:ribosomal RNA-processing protein 9